MEEGREGTNKNGLHERVYTPETNRVEKHFTLLSLLVEALTGLSVTELPATITLTIPEQKSWACAWGEGVETVRQRVHNLKYCLTSSVLPHR